MQIILYKEKNILSLRRFVLLILIIYYSLSSTGSSSLQSKNVIRNFLTNDKHLGYSNNTNKREGENHFILLTYYLNKRFFARHLVNLLNMKEYIGRQQKNDNI